MGAAANKGDHREGEEARTRGPSGKVGWAAALSSRPGRGSPRVLDDAGAGSWAAALPSIGLGVAALSLLLLLPMWPMFSMGSDARGTTRTRHWFTGNSASGLTCAPRFTPGEHDTNENGTTNFIATMSAAREVIVRVVDDVTRM